MDKNDWYTKKYDVKNIHDLVDGKTKGKLQINNPTNEQIKNYKKHESELIDGDKFIKYYNTCNNALQNTKIMQVCWKGI